MSLRSEPKNIEPVSLCRVDLDLHGEVGLVLGLASHVRAVVDRGREGVLAWVLARVGRRVLDEVGFLGADLLRHDVLRDDYSTVGSNSV